MPRRLKVVVVDHCALWSGGEIALARLLPALQDRVDLLVLLGEDGPLRTRLQEAGIRTEVLPLPGRVGETRKDRVGKVAADLSAAARMAPYVMQLAARLRRERADVVHTNSLKAALYAGAAGRLARVPVLWHLRDRIEPDYLPASAVRLVRRASTLLPGAVLANSAMTAGTLPSKTGRLDVVLHDPLPARPPLPDRSGRSTVTVGVVGRLAPWKGQHVFLDAFALAFAGEHTVNGRLIGSAMFGEEHYVNGLYTQVSLLGLSEQVKLTGFQDDIWNQLAELDVLVHCSISPEPFGQVVTEAMASGLAVIASDQGGPSEIVEPGVDGLLVSPDNPTALAEAMKELVYDPALRMRLGNRARASSERFDPVGAAASVMDLYERLVH